MGPVYHTVDPIDGDRAHMISDSGVEDQVAMLLLPEGAAVGSRLVREMLEWSLVRQGRKVFDQTACGKPQAVFHRHFFI